MEYIVLDENYDYYVGKNWAKEPVFTGDQKAALLMSEDEAKAILFEGVTEGGVWIIAEAIRKNGKLVYRPQSAQSITSKAKDGSAKT